MACVTRLQVLRGTRSQRLSIVPLEGELIYDTTERKLYIGDGTTVGGVDPTLSEQLKETVADLFVEIFSEIQSDTLSYSYDDNNNQIQWEVIPSAIDHQNLSNVGTYNHAAIDAHIDNMANPHNVTKAQVGLGNADNTSDVDKPVSTAQAAAIASGDSATLASSQSYTDAQIAALIDASPSTLDTLNELAAALGNDPNFAATTADALGKRLRVDTDTQGLSVIQKTNAKTNIDLQNVDNTSDMNKPVSTAQQAALNLKADKATTISAGAGLTGGGDLSANRTIAMPNVGTAGTYGAADRWNQITTDAFGRVTNITSALISIVSTQVSDFANEVRSTVLSGISFVNYSAVVATDSVLTAIGKLQAQINKMEFSFAQYTNSANQTTNVSPGSFTALSIDINQDSVLGTSFTKVNATDIRAEFSGYLRVSYAVEAHNLSGNDRPFRCVIVKNGAAIPWTSKRNGSKINVNRYGSVSGTFMVRCEPNDIFQLGYGNAESASDQIRVYAGGAHLLIQVAKRN